MAAAGAAFAVACNAYAINWTGQDCLELGQAAGASYQPDALWWICFLMSKLSVARGKCLSPVDTGTDNSQVSLNTQKAQLALTSYQCLYNALRA